MSDVPRYDFKLKQGARWTVTLYLTDANRAAKNLAGYSANLQIRDKPGGTIYQELTSSPAAGITITAAAGQIDLVMTTDQTKALTMYEAEYDLFVTVGGEGTCLLEGKFIVKPRKTQVA